MLRPTSFFPWAEVGTDKITSPMKSPTNGFTFLLFEHHEVDSAGCEKLQDRRCETYARRANDRGLTDKRPDIFDLQLKAGKQAPIIHSRQSERQKLFLCCRVIGHPLLLYCRQGLRCSPERCAEQHHVLDQELPRVAQYRQPVIQLHGAGRRQQKARCQQERYDAA